MAHDDDTRIPGGLPERSATPRDDLTGWERAPFMCGCGRGCVSWKDHHAKVASEDKDHDTVIACVLADDIAAAGGAR